MKNGESSFGKRIKSMLKTDFRRMMTSPMLYIFWGISLLLPVLILVMTSLVGTPDPSAGEQSAAVSFTNVWQAFGSAGGMSMDLLGMCNINLLYFAVAIFACLFIGEEYKSGYVKNVFAIRPKKTDYVLSKIVVTFAAAVGMFLLYFVGAMAGGGIAGLSFDLVEVGSSAGGIFLCMLSKIFFTLVFLGIAVTLSSVGKRRLWLSVLGTLAAGMLLFTMIPMITPLNAGAFQAVLCVCGAPLFAAALAALSTLILNKTNLI